MVLGPRLKQMALLLAAGSTAVLACGDDSTGTTSTGLSAGGSDGTTSAGDSADTTSADTNMTSVDDGAGDEEGEATTAGDEGPSTTAADESGTESGADSSGAESGEDTGDPTGDTTEGTTTGAIDLEPPQLIAGDFEDHDTIKLTFSEPVADVSAVDPSRFRMSSAGFNSDGNYTWYYDLGYRGPQPASYVDVIDLLNDPDDSASILLTLNSSPEQIAQICMDMDWWAMWPMISGVAHYAHFKSNGDPTVEDLAGNALEDIAEQWVDSDWGYDSFGGFFPHNMMPIPIDCP